MQEKAPNGQLQFTMTFESLETPFKVWTEPARIRRYCKYFGPNVNAKVIKVDGGKRQVAIQLTTIPKEEFEALLASPVQPEDTTTTTTTTTA